MTLTAWEQFTHFTRMFILYYKLLLYLSHALRNTKCIQTHKELDILPLENVV